ncbi:aldehyde dehydrogenase (NADP(+)) [Nesterenkonia muleiensis]|uniref:aldehyde dehydrogenase (NADP(+)) n=1 Tax=Nesterenkonia muleiensis TaxID=2282648 RepID=UPI000E7344C1|nr:aldehyde dehydrogenase (NADP(+)) [Nesterenkonia muleiensis]
MSTESFPFLHADTPDDVAELITRSAAESTRWSRRSRQDRADVLETMATAFEAHQSEIVIRACEETHLAETRIQGELARTLYQFRFFADVIREGSYLEAIIDHPGSTPMGPRPDLRRMLTPVGPVMVFGASNFPLAFSVPGGDTVSALAAGSSVIVKAHEGHPETSRFTGAVMAEAAREAGHPDLLTLVQGRQTAQRALLENQLAAVAFTGSAQGGQAIQAILATRETPIPFYGELSGPNPMVFTENALEARREEIASDLTASVVGSMGQLCTKPGLVFIPAGKTGDNFLNSLSAQFSGQTGAPLLTRGIEDAYRSGIHARTDAEAVTVISHGTEAAGVRPQLFAVELDRLRSAHRQECFGPTTMIVRFSDIRPLLAVLRELEGSLTGSVHAESADGELVTLVIDAMASRVGRIIVNGYPTGVAVSWAQHHGGPWPSTNSLHTSVGATALRRFLRPIAYQDAPEWVLPPELRDDSAGLPRRVDGVLCLH